MDISERVDRIERELEYIEKQLNQLDSFSNGNNMQLHDPAQFATIGVSSDDLKDEFIEGKQEKLSDRKQELKEKLEAVQQIIE